MTARARRLAVAVLFGEAAFVVLFGAAMLRYPGGTWSERERPGHAFWQNYLCDVARQPSLSGAWNPGATLASAALIVQAATLLPLWLVLADLCPPGRVRRVIELTGMGAVLGASAVPVTALARLEALHAPLILLATALAVVASVAALRGLAGAPRSQPLVWLGAALLAAAIADLALFVREAWFGGSLCSLAPALQKLAALLLVTWATCVALRVLGEAQPPQRSR